MKITTTVLILWNTVGHSQDQENKSVKAETQVRNENLKKKYERCYFQSFLG